MSQFTSQFTTFEFWTEVLTVAQRGGRLWYHAPLDVGPSPIHVLRVFKNGKLRVRGGGVTFTADSDHLSRFRVKKGHH